MLPAEVASRKSKSLNERDKRPDKLDTSCVCVEMRLRADAVGFSLRCVRIPSNILIPCWSLLW